MSILMSGSCPADCVAVQVDMSRFVLPLVDSNDIAQKTTISRFGPS